MERYIGDSLAAGIIRPDTVSDWGPQFISPVWKGFCKALGTSVSLTSGFHPQSNGGGGQPGVGDFLVLCLKSHVFCHTEMIFPVD